HPVVSAVAIGVDPRLRDEHPLAHGLFVVVDGLRLAVLEYRALRLGHPSTKRQCRERQRSSDKPSRSTPHATLRYDPRRPHRAAALRSCGDDPMRGSPPDCPCRRLNGGLIGATRRPPRLPRVTAWWWRA